MLPFARQALYLGRYRTIAQVLGHHGFGYMLEQLGLINLLSLPRRIILRGPPPPPVSVGERLRRALVDLGPTFIKLGQLLSTRPDLLPPDLIIELNKLQDTVPPFPSDTAVGLIESELGHPIQHLFSHFDPIPLAAASLGQVHAARLYSGEDVVVKVQRPDIVDLIHTDLAIISDLAALAQERKTFGEQYDLVDLAWEFDNALREELDYIREASNADRFRRNFIGNSRVHIPVFYHDYCSSRVLTIERLRGVKISNIAGLHKEGIDPKRLARNAVNLIFQEVFQDGFFHSDPHPGNFFALQGEVIGAIDFGQVGTLDRETTRNLLLLLLAIINRNPDNGIRALERMGMLSRQDITPALRRDAQRLIETYADRPLHELTLRATGDALYTLSKRHNLRMPGPLALLLKTIIMMEGIGLQLDPQLDVFGLARPYAERALVEQFSPRVLGAQFFYNARDLAEVSMALPHQTSDMLYQINAGNLRIKTHEEELRPLAGAVIGAANRIAVALVLAALIVSFGLVAIALNIGQWDTTVLVVLGVLLSLGLIITALALIFALIRGRNV
jgi:ubiquinone biosynthesis protein